mgnify:CR=1 FL=1
MKLTDTKIEREREREREQQHGENRKGGVRGEVGTERRHRERGSGQ